MTQQLAVLPRHALPSRLAVTWPRARVRGVFWLIAVLAVQAGMSVHLIWSNTAFQDEALYLWAGRLEISHWLHGTTLPLFTVYFSGAPVIYPVLGAAASDIGGLAAARLVSAAFMLATTALLWATTVRLHGRRPAALAVALFACLGPTIHLGALATFDAPAEFLVALAAWCVVRAGSRGDQTRWMLAASGALLLANVTAYSSAIFDPVVIVLATVTCLPAPGGKAAVRRGAAVAAYLTAALAILIAASSGYYLTGITQTTVLRAAGHDSPAAVLGWAGRWAGLVICLAVVGTTWCWASPARRPGALLPLTLAVAGLLAPLEQARLHTTVSLDKHTDIGAWFAAIGAGYTVSQLLAWLSRGAWRPASTAACAAALLLTGRAGLAQAKALYAWPDAARFVTSFAPLAERHGRLLVEDPSVAEYYLPAGDQWQRWSNTRSVQLPSGHNSGVPVGGSGGPALYARLIRRGYFSVVALNFMATPGLDRQIAADLRRNPSYRVIAVIGYGTGAYTIWRHNAARRPA